MYDTGFYRTVRALIPSGFLKWIDRYTYQGEELQDLIQTNPSPLAVYEFDLSVAQTQPFEVNVPARGFGFYGFTTGSASQAVEIDIYAGIRINVDRPENEFPAKHQRGYRGDFYKLFVRWPAQANKSAKLVLHKFDDRQWQGGQEAT